METAWKRRCTIDKEWWVQGSSKRIFARQNREQTLWKTLRCDTMGHQKFFYQRRQEWRYLFHLEALRRIIHYFHDPVMQSNLITCRNCGNRFIGKYCNDCGEKVYSEHDRHVSHFFEEGLHFITHFEGKLFKTIRTIFTRPGKLSEDYCTGVRKSYFKPLSLFLLLVVVYLLFPKFEGLNMQLGYHKINNYYGSYATRKTAEVQKTTGMNDMQFSEAFHRKSEKVSKFMLVIILPLCALFFWVMTFRKRKYFFDQMVLSTEVNSFFLLWGYLLLPLLLMAAGWIAYLLHKDEIIIKDDTSGIMVYALVCTYAGMAARRFYKLKTWQSILFGISFFLIHYIVVHIVYKFLLFVAVINQIH
jgi:hypothetical protein